MWNPGSPYLNRFIQPDTLTPGVSDPKAWNRFGYVLNNPINLNDPTGHWPCWKCYSSRLKSLFSKAVDSSIDWAIQHPDQIKQATNSFAKIIANKYLPAKTRGSQASVSASANIPYVYGWTWSKSLVTSADGKYMTITASGNGTGNGMPGFSATTGSIHGAFMSPKDALGTSILTTASLGEVVSVTGDTWVSSSKVGNKTEIGKVWGEDIGISLSLPSIDPLSVQVYGMDTTNEPVEKEMSGTGLLLCRLLHQCGRE